jgi:subtilase family serine protease
MNVYIVDAYDLPSAAFDVATFSTATGLPQLDGVGDHGTFTKLTPFGLPPSGVPFGWSIEEALDIEWAHAMAPKANIFLVEALSSSYFDLINAEGVAVAAADVTSNSWGSGEFASEVTIDPTFAASHSPVLFSTGDGGAPGGYPAYSPYVVAVGGTSNFRNAMGYRSSETGWSGSGGGISVFEPEPPYQAVVQGTGSRTIPDVGLIADPATPVIIYSFDDGGYFTVGGTSVACPVFAGFLANVDGARVFAGKVKLGPAFGVLNPELYTIGTSSLYHYSFFDIIVGSNGFPAGPGYDLVTGFGDPLEPALSYRLVTLIP